MPKPRKGERKNAFISRFMRTSRIKDRDKRLAVAYSHWERRNKKR